MSKILVVGGAGYIGSHVTKVFKDAGHTPVVFDNLSSGLRENLFEDLEFIEGDVLNTEAVKKALVGVDAVAYLAAFKAAGESMENPGKYATNNICGAISLLNAMSDVGVKKIIFSSSATVYGDPEYLPLDEKHPTGPANFYGHTKIEIEELLKWYDKLKGIKYATLRYFNAVGYDPDGVVKGLEQNPANLVPILMEAIMGQRDKVGIFGTDYDTPDGTCIRDYVHVNDLAGAHLKSLNYLEDNNSFTINLGSNSGISVKEMIDKAKEISGVDFKVEEQDRRPGDPARSLADSSLAKELLGWEAKFSDIDTIIKTTLDAYKANS